VWLIKGLEGDAVNFDTHFMGKKCQWPFKKFRPPPFW
jgi:hypothetical protein